MKHNFYKISLISLFLITNFLIGAPKLPIKPAPQNTSIGIWRSINSYSTTPGSLLAEKMDNQNFLYTIANDGSLPGIRIVKRDVNNTIIWQDNIVNGNVQTSLSVDFNGNSYLVGRYQNTVTFSNSSTSLAPLGTFNYYIAKYSPTGQLLWANSFQGVTPGTANPVINLHGSANNSAFYVAFTVRNGYLTIPGIPVGNFYSIIVARVNVTNGAFSWSQLANNNTVSTNSMFIGDVNTNNNNAGVFLTGSFNYSTTISGLSINTGTNITSMLTLKYNTNGTIAWVKTEGGSNFEDGQRLEVTDNGMIFVGGSFSAPQLTFSPSNPTSVTVNRSPLSFVDAYIVSYIDQGNSALLQDVATSNCDGASIILFSDIEHSSNFNELFVSLTFSNSANTTINANFNRNSRSLSPGLTYSVSGVQPSKQEFILRYQIGSTLNDVFTPNQLNGIRYLGTTSSLAYARTRFSGFNSTNQKLYVNGQGPFTNYQFGIVSTTNIPAIFTGYTAYFDPSNCIICKKEEKNSAITLLEQELIRPITFNLFNPYSDNIFFSTNAQEDFTLEIYGLNGQKLFSTSYRKEDLLPLNYLENIQLSQGIYLLTIKNTQGLLLKSDKIIISE